MISALTLAAALPLAGMLLVALVNLATAPRLERAPPRRATPRVSVLIPARDEEANLAVTLPALLRSDYPALEVLVLDDESADGTAALVETLAARDEAGRLRLLRGSRLPAGWGGKNWACAQLARHAAGEVLLFCDADVTAAPDAIGRSIAAMQAWDAHVLTALPRQQMRGWAQHAVVPLVTQLPVLAALPLALVPRTRRASLGMGNGQWLAFTRDAYHAVGGHAAVAADVLEDVALARLAKRAGRRLVVALAPRTLCVRMYADARAMREGFAKNLYALLGGAPAPFAAALLGLALVLIAPLPLAAMGRPASPLPLALLFAVRGVAGATMRHGWRSVLLHPVGALAAAALALDSALRTRRGGVRWRGRPAVPTG